MLSKKSEIVRVGLLEIYPSSTDTPHTHGRNIESHIRINPPTFQTLATHPNNPQHSKPTTTFSLTQNTIPPHSLVLHRDAPCAYQQCGRDTLLPSRALFPMIPNDSLPSQSKDGRTVSRNTSSLLCMLASSGLIKNDNI